MSKLILLAALAAPVAVAQEAPPRTTSRAPLIENLPKQVDAPHYCIYEDKKYTEGAIKKVDGVTMICLAEDGIVFSSQQQQRNLEWVYGDSFRGQHYLKPASVPKR
ncbi:DUF1496 domain-containing protein [Massilia varians]|uniref:DUF1496 domain-containing protein n=1 Tax=Massilia varians TaxID=457921 RepID=UPI00351D6D8E